MRANQLGPGRTVGHHVLVRELGRGGMGAVYLARDPRLAREVAIKFVALERPTAVARFLAEARVTARCKHPNIVDIYEIGDEDGQPYLVLEYIDGESAQALVARGPLAPARAVAILLQVARGLAFAHARGVVHRDLKPANILVAGDGTAKLVDFGIAKAFDDDGGGEDGGEAGGEDDGPRELTATDDLPGTLQYVAPEQVRRDATDDRVDVWAFGVTLYQLLSGRRPLEGLGARDVLAHLSDLEREVPRLDAPEVPAALIALTHRCLEKRLELRVGSAGELVGALEAIAAELATGESPPVEGAREGPAPSPAPTTTTAPIPRRRARVWIAGAVAVVAVAAIALVAGKRARAPRETPVRIDPGGTQRIATLEATLVRLDRDGATAEGDRLLADFLADERDPEALARAWLAHGDRDRARAGAGTDVALASYTTAYARSADPRVQRRALLAVAQIYLERWAWDALAAALDVIDELPRPHDDAAEALRDRLRLAIRDHAATAAPSSATARAAVLLAGRRTGVQRASAAAADVDGDGVDELVAIEGEALVARALPGLAERARRPIAGADEVRCAGRDDRGAYAVIAPARLPRGVQLVGFDGSPAISLDGPEAASLGRCRWIDLDGAGGPELYVFASAGLVRMVREPDGAWQRTWLPMGGDVWDAIGGDLDGDGRRELVIALGEWRGYDVRLVRADAGGALHVHDRVRLGLVGALADLGPDGSGGARLAAIKLDAYPNVRDLPAAHPFGLPAGLYVLALAGDRLALARHVPLPGVTGDPWHRQAARLYPDVWPALVGDVDGDGRRDVIAGIALEPERPNLLAILGERDGGFTPRLVSGVDPQALVARAQGGDALVAAIDGEATLWLLGEGTTAVPPRPLATVPRATPSAAATRDPAVAAAWQRGEHLARIGQVEAAAEALQRVATLTDAPAVQADALGRAARLLTSAGRPAAAVYEALARLPGASDRARAEAWLAAIEDDVAHVALADARDRVERLRGAGLTLDADGAARLDRLAAALPGAPRAVLGAAGLDPAWRIADPSLAHVVPGARHLAVETLTQGPIATLPLAPGPHGLTIVIDAEVTRLEWAGNLAFRLSPDGHTVDGELTAGVGARGGGRVYQRAITCTGTYPSVTQRYEPLPDADATIAVRIELAVVPGTRRGRCRIVASGLALGGDLEVAPSPARVWTLSIGADHLAAMTSATARITSITVAGATPIAPPPSPLDDAALAVATHRADDARAHLARLDRATAATWPAVRLAAITAVESGDRTAAIAILTAALRGPAATRPSVAELARLARARDGQFLPAVRAAMGPRAALVVAAAWSVTAHHDLDEPRVRTAIVRDLDELPPPTAETRDATLSLLGYRGEALLAAGRPDEARRALTDALALLPAAPSPPMRDRAERIALLLASDAAARGDAALARRWVGAALERANHPELAADAVLLDPDLRAIAVGPAWDLVRRLGRPLADPP